MTMLYSMARLASAVAVLALASSPPAAAQATNQLKLNPQQFNPPKPNLPVAATNKPVTFRAAPALSGTTPAAASGAAFAATSKSGTMQASPMAGPPLAPKPKVMQSGQDHFTHRDLPSYGAPHAQANVENRDRLDAPPNPLKGVSIPNCFGAQCGAGLY